MRADATELGNGFDRLTARLHEYLLKNLTAHASVLCLWQAKSDHWKQYAGDLFYGASVFVLWNPLLSYCLGSPTSLRSFFSVRCTRRKGLPSDSVPLSIPVMSK